MSAGRQHRRRPGSEEIITLCGPGHMLDPVLLEYILKRSARSYDLDVERRRQWYEGELKVPIDEAESWSQGWCRFTLDEIGDELMLPLSKSTISRALTRLIERGYIQEHRVRRFGTGSATRYRPNVAAIEFDLNRLGYTLATVLGSELPTTWLSERLKMHASQVETDGPHASHDETDAAHASQNETQLREREAPASSSPKEEEIEPLNPLTSSKKEDLPSLTLLTGVPAQEQAGSLSVTEPLDDGEDEEPASTGTYSPGDWRYQYAQRMYDGLAKHDALFRDYVGLTGNKLEALLQRWAHVFAKIVKPGKFTMQDMKLLVNWLLAEDEYGEPTCWWLQTRNLQTVDKLYEPIGNGVRRVSQLLNQAKSTNGTFTKQRPTANPTFGYAGTRAVGDITTRRRAHDDALEEVLRGVPRRGPGERPVAGAQRRP